ncbi:MAG TPA: hypothetical protein VJ032_09985 [Thermoanaerobaculia bacterium]|nr:hypothetical protein [Thermoanaerobaculia bacterium]
MAGSRNKLSTPARKSGRKSNAAIRGESPSPKAAAPASKPKKLAATKPQAGVTRATASGDGDARAKKGVVARAASRVGKAIKSVTSKIRPGGKKRDDAASAAQTPRAAKKTGTAKAARVARRDSDIPMDRIAETYTPQQTSLKGGMRGNGADRQHDQELARGVADDRWNDEDIITNKSGDPRIGTHGRTYEPGEAKTASRNRE